MSATAITTEPYWFEMVEMAIFDSSTFSGGTTYDLLNGPSSYETFPGAAAPTTVGFPDDIKILQIYNGSTVGVILSYNYTVVPVAGVPTSFHVRNAFLPAGATLIVDLQTNHADNASYGAGTKNGRRGQTIFGNSSAGTGNIYIMGYR